MNSIFLFLTKHKNTKTQKHKNTKTQKHKTQTTQKHKKHKNTKTQKHFFLNYTEHLLGEAAFQIMEAKNILHNLDEVFPEIAAHLQTMMATRYFLQLERNNIDKYLHTGL